MKRFKELLKKYIILDILVIGCFVGLIAKATVLKPVGMDPNGYYTIADTGDGYAMSSIIGLQSALNNKQDAITMGTSAQFLKGDLTLGTIPNTLSYAFTTPSRSIGTSTAGGGFQLSTTRNATVSYNVTITSTATISASAMGVVVLEMAPTNSSTPSDWVEVGRVSNGQAISLAVALQSVQTVAGNLRAIVPSGYYVRIRSIMTGSASVVYNSGQEVLM